MAIKIHGSPYSTCTKRVLTVCAEKNIPYELVEVDFAIAEHKSPAFLALQPFGKVPVLEDDGFLLFESRAMCKYLEEKYKGQGTKLMPEVGDFKAYGLFEQACSIEENYFNPSAEGIAYEKIFKPGKGAGPTDEANVAKLASQLDAILAVYDKILGKQKYLAGGEFTLADLYHLPYGTLDKTLGFKGLFDKHPNVTRWFDACEARESWKKVNVKRG